MKYLLRATRKSYGNKFLKPLKRTEMLMEIEFQRTRNTLDDIKRKQ